jgi:hypothetical protein
LPFGGAVDARIGAAGFPTIQISLRFFQALEAFSLEGCVLGVSDAALNFSFSIWILDPARQSDTTIVSQHVAIEGIQSGIVDVGDKYTFLQIIEHHDAGTAAESTECFLVQLGPDARAGAEGEQAYRLAAASERQHEQSCASVFAGLRIADHRSSTVIDLGLFSGCGNDHGSRLRGLVSAKLAHETFDGLIAAVEPALGHQVLPECRVRSYAE